MKCYKTILTVTALTLSTAVNSALIERLDGLAYYDDEADLTWLANANIAGTSMTLADANNWAASLDIAGVTGWRLANSDTCTGINCTGSELGNLFYNVLGGSANNSIATTHNSNYDLFSNIQSFYWANTGYIFVTSTGNQVYFNGVGNNYAWGVYSGDVSAVPVPAAAWLFGSGLIGLVGLARRKS